MRNRTERLKRNDVCWCGSGLKYKKCHLPRESAVPVALGQVHAEMNKEFRKSECLHPEASHKTCGKVVDAHTLQRASTLAALTDGTGHVLWFEPSERSAGGLLPLQAIGWRQASTFRGFCARHDGPLFAELERYPFAATPKQCFLLGYRALAHELYKKAASVRARHANLQLQDGQPLHAQIHIAYEVAAGQAGASRGLADLRGMKEKYDAALRAEDYRGIRALILEFEGDLCLASTGLVHPVFDADCTPLQDLVRVDRAQGLAISIVRTEAGGAIVFSWVAGDNAPERFISALKDLPDSHLIGYLVEYIFYHIENTYFSKRWWDTLSQSWQQRLHRLASVSNPYYSGCLPKGASPYTPWSNLRRLWL